LFSVSFYTLVLTQKNLKYGLLVKGENSQGMDVKIINSATEYHSAVDLNLSLSIFFLRAIPAPAVISVIAMSIIVICSIPKNRS